MRLIELEDKIIYQADKDKKVKFKNTKVLYTEISVNKDDEREVIEVNDGNL